MSLSQRSKTASVLAFKHGNVPTIPNQKSFFLEYMKKKRVGVTRQCVDNNPGAHVDAILKNTLFTTGDDERGSRDKEHGSSDQRKSKVLQQSSHI